jgi:L-malate glycosyltransferase
MSTDAGNKRIRILFFIDSVDAHAGTENQVVQLIQRLDYERFEVHLACLEPSRRLEELDPSCKIVIFPVTSVYSLRGVRAILALRRYLNTHEIDILQIFMSRANILGVIAAQGSRCPAVIASRRNLGYWFKFPYRQMFRYLNRHTTRLLANSDGARRAAIELEEVEPEKVDVLYNGVEMAAYDFVKTNLRFRSEIGIPDDAAVVGMVANLRPVKDYPLFLRSARIVADQAPNAVFLLVGRGPLKEELLSLASELGIGSKVFITDGRGSVPDALHCMSIGCLSSSSEGFSNAILEYMAAGLPVVATDVGGNREAIEHGVTGYIVPDRTPESFASPIIELLGNEARRRAMGRAGYERCRRLFDMDVAVREHEKYYERLARVPASAGVK